MAGLIPQDFIDDLVARADVVEVIGRRVQLKKAGREFKACCPFHDEKTPSFTVSPNKGFYHCFGCGAHGTAVGFLMDFDHMTFVEAIESHVIEVREEAELEIIQAYLPEQLGEDELAALVDEVIEATGAENIRDMGKVMGAIKAKVAGKADMGAVGAMVKARLA